MDPLRRSAVAAVLVLALLVAAPASASTAFAPATGDAVAEAAAAKKKKKKKKKRAAKRVCKVEKVKGKRKRVCSKRKPPEKPAADKPATPAPKPPATPATPIPTPPATPATPATPPPPPPAPVDPEQYRADEDGRRLMSCCNVHLERATGSGFAMEYTRIYLRQGGRLKIARSDYNINMGERCASVSEGTWAFNRAYKPPEGGLLVVLDITPDGGAPGTDTFWFDNSQTVRVGKDLAEYQINDDMSEPC